MELIKQLLTNFWLMFWVGLFLTICIGWSIWLHMSLKYRHDDPPGNEIDSDFIAQDLKELNEIKLTQARLKMRKNNE